MFNDVGTFAVLTAIGNDSPSVSREELYPIITSA